MKKPNLFLFLSSLFLLGWSVGCGSGAGEDQQKPIVGELTLHDLQALFDHQPDISLDIQEAAVSEEAGGIEVHDISFAQADGGRVRAYLVVPPGDGPFAGVLFMHWGGGSRNTHKLEAVDLAARGAVSLLIDAPFKPDRETFIQTVINLRRGTDLLIAQPKVDADRLGYVGHSWGAGFGAILAGIDQRFETYILTAGLPSFSSFFEQAEMAPLDGIHYVGRAAPASLFFQAAELDESIPREDTLQFYEAASDPKEIRWYPTNHRFALEEAYQDRLEWLVEALGLE
jgi:dienelactone hydrolase